MQRENEGGKKVSYFVDLKLRESRNSTVSLKFPYLAAEIVIHSVKWSKVLLLSLDGLFYTLLAWNTAGDYWNINVFHFKVC